MFNKLNKKATFQRRLKKKKVTAEFGFFSPENSLDIKFVPIKFVMQRFQVFTKKFQKANTVTWLSGRSAFIWCPIATLRTLSEQIVNCDQKFHLKPVSRCFFFRHATKKTGKNRNCFLTFAQVESDYWKFRQIIRSIFEFVFPFVERNFFLE